MSTTVLQSLARRVGTDPDPKKAHNFIRQLITRVRIGRTTMPDPATADYERRDAYNCANSIYRSLMPLNKHFKKFMFMTVGGMAAIHYGTTRTTKSLDILVPYKQYYRIAEPLMLSDEIDAVLITDNENFKYGENIFERTWLVENGKDNSPLYSLTFYVSHHDMIDVAFADDYDEQRVQAGSRSWPVCSVEMLFVLKCIYGRTMDVADLAEIIQGGVNIDWERVMGIAIRMCCDHHVFEALKSFHDFHDLITI